MDILQKIMANNSAKRAKKNLELSTTLTNSEHNIISSISKETEISRTNSMQDLTKMERKPRIPADLSADNFPPEIVNIAKQVKGLASLLHPPRRLKFKFGAMIELEQKPIQIKKSFSLIRKSVQPKEPVIVSLKCLFILFDDLLCICSEKQLEVKLKLEECWMETEKSSFIKNIDNIYPFFIKTPEKRYKCSLDQDSKLTALRKVWDLTIDSRLEKEGLYLNSSTRLLQYEFQDGRIYDGEWKDSKFNGKGQLRHPSGEYYDGYWFNGKYNGCGTLILPNTERYDGYWKSGKKHGNGTLYFTSKDPIAVKFVGNWKLDKKHGLGQLYLKNGCIVEANWNSNQPTSPVLLYLEDSKTRYIGDINENYERNGFGVCIYSSIDERYYGQWVNEEKQGKGFFVTSKGTEYHGNWFNGQMEGQGNLYFGNDESLITGRFSGDSKTGIIKIDGEFKLSKFETQLRVSTMQGYKWHCLFTMRLSNPEQNPDSIKLTKILEESITAHTDIKNNFCNIFKSNKHPLGKLVIEFSNIFNSMYIKPKQYYTQLNSAVDDLRSFLNLMSDNFISQILHFTVPKEECEEALQEILFPLIYENLFLMYNISNEEIDEIVAKNIKQILQLDFKKQMAVCGIDEKFWNPIEEIVESDIRIKAFDLNPSADEAPYQSSVNAIRSLSLQKTASQKLHFVKKAASRVESLLKKVIGGQFGADEFLPMFCFVMVQSGIPHLKSETCFMEDFMDENLQFNVYGYMLAQLQIATGFIKSCDIKNKLAEIET